MKRKKLLGLALCISALFTACSFARNNASDSEAENSPYHKISAEEAKDMIDSGDVTVVDVRTEEEYNEAHIPGAVLVSNESISSEPPEALPDKDGILIVYCRTGVRSRQASDKLVELGYTQVYDMGGIVDWEYETESEEGK